MITALLVSVLAVCAVVTVLRIPAALRAENRSLFGIFLLITVAMVFTRLRRASRTNGASGLCWGPSAWPRWR